MTMMMTMCKNHVLPSLPLRCFLTFLATQGKPLCQGSTLMILLLFITPDTLMCDFDVNVVSKLVAQTHQKGSLPYENVTKLWTFSL